LKPLDMSVEDAVKMVISVGMVTPPYDPTAKPRGDSLLAEFDDENKES